MTNNNFDIFNLKDNLLRGIYSYGFEKPSNIQQKAILPILEGKDIVAQAQSGTGKTGAFSVAVLEKINVDIKSCQAIIISPIRELAQQTYNVMTELSKYLNININLSIGGTDLHKSYKEFNNGVHVVVGTPGRIYDLINRNILRLDNVNIIVIDEADEMLSYGFKEQIKLIINKIPDTSQICLFSATISEDILDLSNKFMKDPVNILVKNDEITLEGITQFYIAVGEDNNKISILKDIYDTLTIGQTIIYVNTIKRVEILNKQLEDAKFPSVFIHGNMEQDERNVIMKQFRNGQSRILITTDLLARGIDIQQVSLVINYDLPPIRKKENYIHRIGRSGRFGRKGVAINFVSNNDMEIKDELEKFYNTQIDEMPMDITKYF
jgi:translation initiation factor 4A